MSHPRISVITPTYNAALTLERCLLSVAGQHYPDLEHIIMDGGSTDGTIALVRKFQQQFSHILLFLEKDGGIYDAINRGMDRSTGEWLYFLGADDVLYNDTVLNDMAREEVFKPERIVYGNVLVKGNTSWAKDQAVYDGKFTLHKLLRKNICHQAIFYPRSVIQTVGYFNTKYSTTADWDYNLRCFASYPFFFADRIIAIFQAGGKSTDGTDDSITGDFPGNLISYFDLNPWSDEQYDMDSPFFYHMSKFREHSYEQKISALLQTNAELEDDLAKFRKSCMKTIDHLNASISDLREQLASYQQNMKQLQVDQLKVTRQNLHLTSELDRTREKIEELNALINEKESRIATILQSYTWKTGHVILTPLKYIADRTKKDPGK